MQGKVQLQSWVQIATGYIVFLLFGTGVDAHNLYKRMLVSIGIGKIWSSLHIESGSGSTTPHSFIAARTWTSTMSSRAKSMLWSSKTEATVNTYDGTTRNNSVVLEAIPHLSSTTTNDTLYKQHQDSNIQQNASTSTKPSFLKRVFGSTPRTPILPLSSSHYRNITETPTTESDRITSGVHAHAWAVPEGPSGERVSEADGVHVIREVHQDCHDRDVSEQDFEKKVDAWA
jgi:pheromone a factor receptor